MKTTMDYMIGNTAVQIINKGKRIKVVDVKKEKIRRRIWKQFVLAVTLTGLLVGSCFYIVRLQNQKALLDQSVYQLQVQVDQMTKENVVLQKEEQEVPVDYHMIFKKALELGMNFPTNRQIGTYKSEKSSAVRVNFGEKNKN